MLSPAGNRTLAGPLNLQSLGKLSRALAHVHYTFQKKLSHTADSQDQRHRTVPGSRPLLSRTVPGRVDVVEPELIRDEPGCHRVFREAVEASWEAALRSDES